MQRARFIGMLGLLVVLGLVGFGGGCSSESTDPMSQEESEKLRESRKKSHVQLKEEAKKAEAAESRQQAAGRKGGHRRGGG
jgi:hypothetical protein